MGPDGNYCPIVDTVNADGVVVNNSSGNNKCVQRLTTTTTTTNTTKTNGYHWKCQQKDRPAIDSVSLIKISQQQQQHEQSDDGSGGGVVVDNNLSNGGIISSHQHHNHLHKPPRQPPVPNGKEEPPIHIQLLCCLSYLILILFGYLRDFLRNIGIEKTRSAKEANRENYVPLYQSFESFFTRNIYRRVCDGCNRPITCVPGAYIDVMDRKTDDFNWTFEFPGTTTRAINMGSYNYLGFAENSGPNVDRVETVIDRYGVGMGSTRHEIGTTAIHRELESLLARFLGVESSIVFGMGFATNSTNIPTLAGKGALILSDEYNHASIILGSKKSGSTISLFKHNDMKDLEEKLRKHIVDGQYKTHRPWKKIIIIVEGIYSMEGTIINLPEIIKLKRKYKCYVYLDEAHSIGAIGQRGGGVADYFGCDPKDIDLLMGTFTKSFGAAGGYIAGRKSIIDYIAVRSQGATYGSSIAPCIVQQIISVINVIMGNVGTDDGKNRIAKLSRNARYFRQRLKQMGFVVYGNNDSPVVPIMICFCSKIAAVVRQAFVNGIGTVGAAFPATPLTTGRVRFCVSASHTKEMLDKALDVMDSIGDEVAIKYSKQNRSNRSQSTDQQLIVY
ncbi:serine palmitoyltransferase 3-like [Oppia nitens]|uniref:serine palmitoyltransferase 3-like n=1 Tax=Oppia nitens TaxID=1686743 RepID=UPI0023DB069A|nr:serine palmitoyltransferase 3-like [Oppia nitens]